MAEPLSTQAQRLHREALLLAQGIYLDQDGRRYIWMNAYQCDKQCGWATSKGGDKPWPAGCPDCGADAHYVSAWREYFLEDPPIQRPEQLGLGL